MAFLRILQASEPLIQRSAIYRVSPRRIASLSPQYTRPAANRSFTQRSYPQQSQSTSTPTTPKPNPTTSTPSPAAARAESIASQPTPTSATTSNISKTGLSDKPLELDNTPAEKIDWTRSFHGLSAEPFPKEVADILLAETSAEEVEIKPDGILYLPEIKYRRILNRAFGPGGWGLVPRSESIVTPKTVTREYALVCNGRYVPSLLLLPTLSYYTSLTNITFDEQPRLRSPRRTRLLLPRRNPHCDRRMPIQRTGAVLQGLRDRK